LPGGGMIASGAAIPSITLPAGQIGVGIIGAGHLEARIPKPSGRGDENRGDTQKASNELVEWIKGIMKKDINEEAAREFHDEVRLTDRTVTELISDAKEVYSDWGMELPRKIAAKRPH
jgi:hypothetical protein